MKTSAEIIEFFENVPKEKRSIKITPKRTVRDLVVHLAAWKIEATKTYEKLCNTGEKPWFWGLTDFSEFNRRIDEKYKNLTYKEAVDLLKKAYKDRDELQKRYGKEKLIKSGLGWMFEDNVESHALLHLEQIVKVITN